MSEKRYRTEQIEGITLPFIVDNYSAKKHKIMTGYKAYDTKTVKKCDELTDLLNELQDKSDKKQEHIVILENKIHRMREAIHKLEWLASHRNGDLMRENRQLKKQLECSREEANDYCEELMGKDEFIRLYKRQRDDALKENEELKADNNRLVNETAKVVAEHQGKILDLIDEKIDELEKKYKFGQEVYHGCPMHNVRFGINTLKELKKELIE